MDAATQPVSDDFKGAIQDRLRVGRSCPLCGRPTSAGAPKIRHYRAWAVFGAAVVIGLVRLAAQYYQSPLRTLPVDDAFRRAASDARVRAVLGEPLRKGSLIKDRVYHDETGWSEAKLRIPIAGPRHRGTLNVVAGKGTGPWIFSTLQLVVDQQPPIDLLGGKLVIGNSPDYESIHTEPAATPEMRDEAAQPPSWDGVYPVVAIQPQVTDGQWQFHGAVSSDKLSIHETPVNVFQVDLSSGLFILRQTDLFEPDVMPLALTRTYRPWDRNSRAFGLGTNHPYDIAPQGSRNPYTFMQIYMEDGSTVHLDRISRGTSYADAVYEHRNTTSEFYKARFWWNGNGWSFRLADGRLFLFPESYNAQNLAQGAPYEIRDAAGHRIRLERDPDRNLRLLVSPNGHFIRFEYDDLRRITEATDDQGRTVRYAYDSAGRLISVTAADGNKTRFTYEQDRMITVEDGSGHVLLRNFYEDQRITQQNLADGGLYRYSYQFSDGGVAKTRVILPDGSKAVLTFEHGILKNQPVLTAASR